MADELSSIELRFMKAYVFEWLQGCLAFGAFIWIFATLKIYHFDRMSDSLWDHTAKENVGAFIAFIVNSNPTFLSALCYVLAGILFCVMTCCVMAFYYGSIDEFYARLAPKKDMTESQRFLVAWFGLLPASIPIWFVFASGLYQLARFELWVFYR